MNPMFRSSFIKVVLASLLLSAATTCVQAQQRHPVLPYSSPQEEFEAEGRSIEKEAIRLEKVKQRYDKWTVDLHRKIEDLRARWNANEAFGLQRSSGAAHQRNYNRYLNTRNQLVREWARLRQEIQRHQLVGKGIVADYKALEERMRRHIARLGTLSASDRGLVVDENAPRKR
jgi:hypothetical protein